jgi:hypothetical protein
VTWEDEFESALAAPEPLQQLSGRVSGVLQAGANREDDDIVLEVLDYLTGWCLPSKRI